ncbi:hypothetical protein BDD12DRAFT_864759 [Trichophaea hybrida]|nr:hypothetical protein BDD12DRAFT_864759 [Trichophaea hybrida]
MIPFGVLLFLRQAHPTIPSTHNSNIIPPTAPPIIAATFFGLLAGSRRSYTAHGVHFNIRRTLYRQRLLGRRNDVDAEHYGVAFV